MKLLVWIFLTSLLFGSSLSAQVDLTDSNLPIIIINTNNSVIVDEPKTTATMKIIDNGPDNRNQITDTIYSYDGFIGIEFRGATSQNFPKKGYGLETRKGDGSNRNVELFGMPKENDWILHGPYSDKSLMRNALAYKLAGEVMSYAPRTQFCELVINNNYRGIYLFTEKIKIDKGRINISKLNAEDNSADALTGGYIIKIDKTAGGATEGWSSVYPPMPGAEQRTYYQYHSPSSDKMTDDQRKYIRDFISDFENTMADVRVADSLERYRQFIEPESFIDFILLNELCKNVDAYRLSTYLHKDRNSINPLLKAGPVWDFNLGFGNVDFCAGPDPEGWVIDYNSICPEDGFLIQFWWSKLLEDKKFGTQLVERWRELRTNKWSDDRIENCIGEIAGNLAEAQIRNFDQWPVLGAYVWPNAFIGDTYQAEIGQLNSWLKNRLNWMDRSIEELSRHQSPAPVRSKPQIYPNPFTEKLTFDVSGVESEELKVEVYNLLGQLVFSKVKPILNTGIQRIDWSSKNISPGSYYYRIYFDQEGYVEGNIIRQ